MPAKYLNTRDFLLHLAILSRLDASVCQAVTAAPTWAVSQHMLALLERANLFLVPLDEERQTYRLHDLFREALLSALHTSQPEMVPLLHRRAADFYEAQGQWAEAITHALAGASFSTAARLMEQTAEQFWMRGEAATMASFVLALPDPLAHEHIRLEGYDKDSDWNESIIAVLGDVAVLRTLLELNGQIDTYKLLILGMMIGIASLLAWHVRALPLWLALSFIHI